MNRTNNEGGGGKKVVKFPLDRKPLVRNIRCIDRNLRIKMGMIIIVDLLFGMSARISGKADL